MSRLRMMWDALMAGPAAVWLHVHWHGGRPCPKAVRAMQDEQWMRSAVRAHRGR